MSEAEALWLAVANPVTGTAVEELVLRELRLQATVFPFQDALLAALRRGRVPALLVLHQLLPGPLEPLAFLARVRALIPQARVIYLLPDGPGSENVVQALLSARVHDFLVGPFGPGELLRLIRQPRSAAEVQHLQRPAGTPAAPALPAGSPAAGRPAGSRRSPLTLLGRALRGGSTGAPAAPAPPPSAARAPRTLPRRLVAVWSPAGTGATTLAANVAALLALDPDLHVCALDFHLTGPSLGLLLDAFRDRDPYDACLSHLIPLLEGDRADGERVRSHLIEVPGLPKLHLLPGLFHPLALPRVRESHVERLLALLRDLFHVVIADVPPPIDYVTTFPTLQAADLVLVVCGPEYPSRFHTRRYLGHLQDLGLEPERVRVVVSGAAEPRASLEADLGVPVAAWVPHLPGMAGWIEQGRPPVLPPETGETAPFRQGVEAVAALVASNAHPRPASRRPWAGIGAFLGDRSAPEPQRARAGARDGAP